MSKSCCSIEQDQDGHVHAKRGPDYFFLGTLGVIIVAIAIHLSGISIPYVSAFAHAATELMKIMWWGLVAGIIAVGLMQHIPRSYFNAMLGRGDTFGGILRAALAGLMLDLCSHGILMVGAKLYERGASLAQVMTFLIASPWNSFSLTLILIALIGLPWTLAFIAGSAVIAILTGTIFLWLTKAGKLPENPHTESLPHDFKLVADAKARLKKWRPSAAFFAGVVREGFVEGRMVMRWLFFGTIIAALIRAFVPTEMLGVYFGPTMFGLLLTLLATTIIEVCSEGSAPIGAELVNRAAAPGNGFAFLMAGVSTDYTEILVIREFTKSWKIAFLLPLITVPQVLFLGWLMNLYSLTN